MATGHTTLEDFVQDGPNNDSSADPSVDDPDTAVEESPTQTGGLFCSDCESLIPAGESCPCGSGESAEMEMTISQTDDSDTREFDAEEVTEWAEDEREAQREQAREQCDSDATEMQW
jgi:hypothetical protein